MDLARKLAVDILKRITIDGAYSSIELDFALFKCNLDERDKSFITNLVYGTLNNLYTIDKIIETYSSIKLKKMENIVLTTLRLGVYQIKYLDKIPNRSAIDEMVNIVKKNNQRSANFVNGVLRSIDRNEKEIKFKNDIETLSFEFSIPIFLTKLIKDQYKKRTKEILEGLRRNEGVFIRVNTTKISRNDYKKKLIESKLEIEIEDGLLDDTIYIKNPGSIVNLFGYKEGYFSVQNESAAFVSNALFNYINNNAKDSKGAFIKETENNIESKKLKFLDVCASPGGKSLYLQELFKNNTNIISCDIYSKKLDKINENAKRLNLKLKTNLVDASIYREEYFNSFDGIICDVPCSGLGLLGRKPDIKLNIKEENIEEIVLLQRNILENISKYIKRDGVIIYSTCTLNKEENENQINHFLENNTNFEKVELNTEDILLKSAREGNVKNFIIKDNMITIIPNKMYDGFFLCGLKRVK